MKRLSVVLCLLGIVYSANLQDLLNKLPVKLTDEQLAKVNELAAKLNATIQQTKTLSQTSDSNTNAAETVNSAIQKLSLGSSSLANVIAQAREKIQANVQSSTTASSATNDIDAAMPPGFDSSMIANPAVLERVKSMMTAAGINISQILQYLQQNKDTLPLTQLIAGIKDYLPSQYQEKFTTFLQTAKTEGQKLMDELYADSQQLPQYVKEMQTLMADETLTIPQLKEKSTEMKAKYDVAIQQAANALGRALFFEKFGDKIAQLKTLMGSQSIATASPAFAIQVEPYQELAVDDVESETAQAEQPKKKNKKAKNKKNKNKKNKDTEVDE